MKKIFLFVLFFSFTVFIFSSATNAQTQGSLQAFGKNNKDIGLCPLKHTFVRAEISGFLARVKVTQEFENNFKEKIEAVYTFPLPQNAAVDDMTMRVGERVVRGKILPREEAQAVYESAKEQGYVASLLDQERPNIFTQSVANVMPDEKVIVEISYVETLKYDEGTYEFVFPMVVGERYTPQTANQNQPSSPPLRMSFSKSNRAGHDISIEVVLDTGLPIENIASKSHQIESNQTGENRANVKLKNLTTIPNKDFILRYDVAGKKINDALLTHHKGKDGFFTLMIQPPDRVTFEDVMPKELVFVLDTSGSMSGFPIEKAKECMLLALDNLYQNDTFNLITFAGDTEILFNEPVPATKENLRRAKAFLESRKGGGGTEMMKAIKASLEPSDSQQHLRIVCFMTDGYVGNENEIIAEVQKHPNARVFSFGIGSSVNRFLLDKIAEEGRGEAEYVSLNDNGSAAAKRFHERVRNPLLTNLSIDWNGLPVTDVYPQRLSDLFSAKPVIVSGRFTQSVSGTIKLKGFMSGREIVREIPIVFPENENQHDVLAVLWARNKIEDLTRQNYKEVQNESALARLKEDVTKLGLEYRLMTQFTSFVAVEELTVTEGGKPRRVDVPIETPEGSFGTNADITIPKSISTNSSQIGSSARLLRSISGGILNGKAVNLPQPSYPSFGRGSNISGLVSVEVVVNENGKVISAKAVSGPGMLQNAAVSAALKARFTPTLISGQAVKTTGVINYNFGSGGQITIAENTAPPQTKPPTPEEQKQNELMSKLHTSIAQLFLKIQKKEKVIDEFKFLQNGKAEIRVTLNDKTPEVIEELKQLGFEIVLDPQLSKVVIGRIAVEKIVAILELKSVRFIAPQIN